MRKATNTKNRGVKQMVMVEDLLLLYGEALKVFMIYKCIIFHSTIMSHFFKWYRCCDILAESSEAILRNRHIFMSLVSFENLKNVKTKKYIQYIIHT